MELYIDVWIEHSKNKKPLFGHIVEVRDLSLCSNWRSGTLGRGDERNRVWNRLEKRKKNESNFHYEKVKVSNTIITSVFIIYIKPQEENKELCFGHHIMITNNHRLLS